MSHWPVVFEGENVTASEKNENARDHESTDSLDSSGPGPGQTAADRSHSSVTSVMTNPRTPPRPSTLAWMLLAAALLTDKAATAFIVAGSVSSSGSNPFGRHHNHNHYRPPAASSSPSALHSSVTWNNGNSYGKVRAICCRDENIPIIVFKFITANCKCLFMHTCVSSKSANNLG